MAVIPLKTDADIRGAKALNKELGKTDKELEEITKHAKGAAGAANRLAKQADPQKRYNDQMAKLAVAVKQGGLELDHARTLAGKYTTQLERAGQAGKGAFGAKAFGQVGALVGGYFTLQAAVGAVTSALRKQEEQAQAAADATLAGLGSIGELQQISRTPEEFQKNLGFTRSLVARGIFSDIGQAADATFSLSSAGFSDAEKDYLATLAENKLVKGEGLTGFGGALRKSQALFPGGISIQDIADRILATSGETQANATQTALATSQFGAASANLGYSGDASLAGLVLIEERAKNIDEAATQMANLLDAIDKGGLSTGTFAGTIDAIQARIDGGEGAFGILGNKRAVKGFRAIASQRELLDSEAARIGGSSGAALAANYIGSDPITRSAAMAEEAAGEERAAQDALTTERENLVATVRSQLHASRLREGREGYGGFADQVSGWEDYLGLDRGILLNALQDTPDRIKPQTGRAVAEYLQRQAPAWHDVFGRQEGVVERYLERIAEATESQADGGVEGGE